VNITQKKISECIAREFETIHVESLTEGCIEVRLNRPSLRNAFNEFMISELNALFYIIASKFDAFECRVLVLSGEGNVFCAGADLAMMRTQGEASYEANLDDSRRLAKLFSSVSLLPMPVVCVVQGAAVGGGFGLAVCSDIVITHREAVFATTEVRLGLIPAVISPYIVRKLGVSACSYPLLSGTRISGTRAYEMQLAHLVLPSMEDLKDAKLSVVSEILECAPESVRETKRLLALASPLPEEGLVKETVQAIARARGSAEAKHGLTCFFEKKLPQWSTWIKGNQWAGASKDTL
jgi:methylglutaconyl-CoA hydratase